MQPGRQVENAHALAWAHLLVAGFLRPQYGKLLPTLFKRRQRDGLKLTFYNMVAVTHFPNFEYPASEVFKYLHILQDFTLMLNDGNIVKFTPDDEDAFKKWLDDNVVQNIREEKDWVVK